MSLDIYPEVFRNQLLCHCSPRHAEPSLIIFEAPHTGNPSPNKLFLYGHQGHHRSQRLSFQFQQSTNRTNTGSVTQSNALGSVRSGTPVHYLFGSSQSQRQAMRRVAIRSHRQSKPKNHLRILIAWHSTAHHSLFVRHRYPFIQHHSTVDTLSQGTIKHSMPTRLSCEASCQSLVDWLYAVSGTQCHSIAYQHSIVRCRNQFI